MGQRRHKHVIGARQDEEKRTRRGTIALDVEIKNRSRDVETEKGHKVKIRKKGNMRAARSEETQEGR